MISCYRTAAVALTLSLLLASAAQATTYQFEVASGNWGTGADWSPDGVPTTGDTAMIGSSSNANSSVTLNSGATTTVAELQIANVNTNSTGAILEVTGTNTVLNVTGTGTNSWISNSNPGGGDNIGTLMITNGGSVSISASTFEVASRQDNSNGHLILNGNANPNGAKLTITGNLMIVEGNNGGGNQKVSNVTVNNNAEIDVNGGTGLTIGQGNNIPIGSVNFSIDGTSRIDVVNDLILRGGNSTDGTVYLGEAGFAEYTLPLASTSAAGKFSIGRSLFLGTTSGGGAQTSRVVLEVDATLAKNPGQRADANMSFTGTLNVAPLNSARAVLIVNGATMDFAGNGNFVTADNAFGRINLTNATLEVNNFTIRSADDGNGSGAEIAGTGTVTANSILRTDGSFVADGGNLTVQAGSLARNSGIAGVTQLGGLRQAGWYAINGGKLTLPGVTSIGTGKTWGGDPTGADNAYRLVNSVQFQSVTGASGTTLLGELYAANHGLVPTGLVNPIGIWNFTGPTFTSAEMLIRYDDVAAGGSESLMKLWHYTGGAWVDITGTLNTGANTMLSDPISSLSFFAIAENAEAVPEPSTYALGLIGLAGLGLVVWRRRK